MAEDMPQVETRIVSSVEQFLRCVEDDYAAWETAAFPWFRGEPDPDSADHPVLPLLPKVFRPKPNGMSHDENALLQFFRLRAPILGLPIVPDVKRTDQWLFSAQHLGLPTRLLDWTEGALIALYFALKCSASSVVWMLNHHRLNLKAGAEPGPKENEPTLTWLPGPTERPNLYNVNIRAAWEPSFQGADLPVAAYPTNVHPRMSAQHSCFTVHGSKKLGLHRLVGSDCLVRYAIRISNRGDALLQVRRLGVAESTLFPEPGGLSEELGMLF